MTNKVQPDDGQGTGERIFQSLRGRMAMAKRNRRARDASVAPAAAPVAETDAPLEVAESLLEEPALDANAELVEELVEEAPVEETILFCTVCSAETFEENKENDNIEPSQVVAVHTCISCKTPLCEAHSYHEEGGTLNFCAVCADETVGICAECGVLHARPCRECSKKVCDACAKKVIERWGWGGAPGQGGATSWFPFIRTYCQEHGQHRIDIPKPGQKNFVGYDGSSPEW